jgi:hypothetical protein
MKTKHFVMAALSSILIFGPVLLISRGWSQTVVDHSIYSGLLKKYVHQARIDYRGFKTQEAHLD